MSVTNVGRNITCQSWGLDPFYGLNGATGGVVLDKRTGKQTPILCGGQWQQNKTIESKCFAIRPTGAEVVTEMQTRGFYLV